MHVRTMITCIPEQHSPTYNVFLFTTFSLFVASTTPLDIVLPWMSYLFLTSWFRSDILLTATASPTPPRNNLNVTPPYPYESSLALLALSHSHGCWC